MRRLTKVVALCLLFSSPCYGFLGIGDITFDPAVHAELVTLYEQTVGLYRATMQQITRLREIKEALKSAQQNIEGSLNANLTRYAQDALTVTVPQSFREILADADTAVYSSDNLSRYYHAQVQRLARVARLGVLNRAATTNLGTASKTNMGMRLSGDITAQSTATLAALASQAAKGRAKKALRDSAARHNGARIASETAAIYAALGTS